jgi:23S rRNA (uracil1939-C5)-methyltransferase
MVELGTHKLVHVPNCAVHHPLVNRVAAVVRGALVDARVPTYSDAAHLGLARYLQVVVERDSQRAQVVLVANSPTPDPLAACLDLVRERLGDELHSLWFNANVEPRNAILGPEFVKWCGADTVVERFGDAPVHYPPGAFGQNNLEVAERIVAHVRERVPEGARVAEFYAGVGAIGLSLVARVGELRMNEVSPQSLLGLETGLAALAPDVRARVHVVPGPAGECADAALGADVVIADPPRRGLDPALRDRLAADPPSRFVYVSCGLESLVADVARLAAGGLRLRELAAFDLMPYTGHVETVATFERA